MTARPSSPTSAPVRTVVPARWREAAVIHEASATAALQGDGLVWLTAQRVEDDRPPSWPAGDAPKQVHLEFAVAELEHSVAAAVAAGARLADMQPSPERWQVLLDPAGYPFCFTTMIAPS